MYAMFYYLIIRFSSGWIEFEFAETVRLDEIHMDSQDFVHCYFQIGS